MFGFIKNLFGGIFGFIGKVLGLNKSEYALDLGGPDTTQSESPKATKSEPAKAEPPKETKPAPAQTQAAPAKSAKPAPKPAETKAKPEPAKAPVEAGGFAPSYLMPAVTSTRRRPGANMTSYLSMARQMKSN